ncbi:Protein TANC1 [Talaromyces islandicus]|uniref:Protein TANC1 n=1 Tax=Talaromyces islandicus TaxID=28573 RepID=A0A0U1LZ52_TALIS|nr:Protein TANC1 [Talaromyces islandicus]
MDPKDHASLYSSDNDFNEIDGFVRYSRLGLFQEANDVYDDVLKNYEYLFPVMAEYAEHLIEQGSYRDSYSFLDRKLKRAEEHGFGEGEVALLRLWKGLANFHLNGDLKEALLVSRAWRQRNCASMTPDTLCVVDYLALQVYLLIFTSEHLLACLTSLVAEVDDVRDAKTRPALECDLAVLEARAIATPGNKLYGLLDTSTEAHPIWKAARNNLDYITAAEFLRILYTHPHTRKNLGRELEDNIHQVLLIQMGDTTGYQTVMSDKTAGRHVEESISLPSPTINLLDIKWLIKAMTDLNATPARDQGRSKIQAAAEGGHFDMVKRTLEAVADVNAGPAENGGRPALQAAAEGGCFDILKKLLGAGADINAVARQTGNREFEPDFQENAGRKLLSCAAEKGHNTIMYVLLEKGANTDFQDESDRTPLSYAAEKGHNKMMKVLLEKGANVDFQDKSGRTPLSYTAEKGQYAIMKVLLEVGVNVDFQDKNDRTPLSYAAENGHNNIIKTLLEKGANVNFQNNSGRTPLSYAAEKGHEITVKVLLEKGANVDFQDHNGRTPLSYAAGRGYYYMVEMLLKKGANSNS